MYESKRKLIAAGGLSVAAALSMAIPAGATANQGSATETLTAGAYSVLGQSAMSFPSTALTGADQTLAQTTTAAIDFSDATGSGSGWNVTANVSTLFNNNATFVINVADGVTNSTTTVTSATANFQAADVGSYFTGSAGIPANDTIASVTNATTAVLTAAATATAGSITFHVLATLPNATISITGRPVPLHCDTGSTCTVGTEVLGGTVALPNLTAPSKIFNVAAGTGMGNEGGTTPDNETWALGGTLFAGTARTVQYTATITYTMATGV